MVMPPTPELRTCPAARGILVSRPEAEPVSPAVEGRFFTSGPPGKSLQSFDMFAKDSILEQKIEHSENYSALTKPKKTLPVGQKADQQHSGTNREDSQDRNP